MSSVRGAEAGRRFGWRGLIALTALLLLSLVVACAGGTPAGVASPSPTSTRPPSAGVAPGAGSTQVPPTATSQPLPPFWPDMPLSLMPGWMQPMLLERLNMERLRLLEVAPRLLQVDIYSEAPRWRVDYGAEGDEIMKVTGNLERAGACNGAEFFPEPCRNWMFVKKGARVTLTAGDSRAGWWPSLDRSEGSAECMTSRPYASDTVALCTFTMDSDRHISIYWHGGEFPGLLHFVYPTCPTQRRPGARTFDAAC